MNIWIFNEWLHLEHLRFSSEFGIERTLGEEAWRTDSWKIALSAWESSERTSERTNLLDHFSRFKIAADWLRRLQCNPSHNLQFQLHLASGVERLNVERIIFISCSFEWEFFDAHGRGFGSEIFNTNSMSLIYTWNHFSRQNKTKRKISTQKIFFGFLIFSGKIKQK